MNSVGAAELVSAASSLVVAGAVALGALIWVASHSWRAAVSVFLDLLLAAGLLRLVVADTWGAIATAAVVAAIRKVAVAGLTHRVAASTPP